MYEKLTKHIEGMKGPIDYYGSNSLFTAIHKFVDSYTLANLTDYQRILAQSNIKWSYDSMKDVDVDKLDAVTTVALLVAAVRADHFSEGIWQHFIDEGHVERWLVHLKSLDV